MTAGIAAVNDRRITAPEFPIHECPPCLIGSGYIKRGVSPGPHGKMSAFELGGVDIHSDIRVTLSQGIASRTELERKGMIREDTNW